MSVSSPETVAISWSTHCPLESEQLVRGGCGIVTPVCTCNFGCTDVAKYTEEDAHAALVGS